MRNAKNEAPRADAGTIDIIVAGECERCFGAFEQAAGDRQSGAAEGGCGRGNGLGGVALRRRTGEVRVDVI